MPDPLLANDGEEEIQRALDYLGQEAPVSLATKPALPVGGAPAGVSTGPPTTSGGGTVPPSGSPGGVGGGGDAGGGLEGPDTGLMDALNIITRGGSAFNVASKLFDKFGNASTPVSVGSDQILQDAPSGGFVSPTRGFTAPSPTFGGEVGGLSGADASLGAAAEQGAAEGAGGLGGALGNLGNGLALVGPSLGMLPRWLQGQGGPPITDAFGGAMMTGGALVNPLTLFGTVGAGLISGILESAGVVGPGDYGPRREQFAQELKSYLPVYADAIAMAQSPEELSYLLGPDSRGGAPWWVSEDVGGPGWNFNYDPANTTQPVNVQGLITDEPTQALLNQYLGGLVTSQRGIIDAARSGDPRAQAFLANSMAERTRRGEEWRTQRAQYDADTAANLGMQGGGP